MDENNVAQVKKEKKKKTKEVNIGVAIINCRLIIFPSMSRIKTQAECHNSLFKNLCFEINIFSIDDFLFIW